MVYPELDLSDHIGPISHVLKVEVVPNIVPDKRLCYRRAERALCRRSGGVRCAPRRPAGGAPSWCPLPFLPEERPFVLQACRRCTT